MQFTRLLLSLMFVYLVTGTSAQVNLLNTNCVFSRFKPNEKTNEKTLTRDRRGAVEDYIEQMRNRMSGLYDNYN